jgi:hypothetical protein
LVADLPFAEDVIFVIDEGSRARCLDGTNKPFLRVRSRFRERNEATRRLLGEHEDIECVVADFQPRRGSGPDSSIGDDR